MGKEVLNNRLKKYDLKSRLVQEILEEGLFRRFDRGYTCTGHCHVYPYFLEIIKDRGMN